MSLAAQLTAEYVWIQGRMREIDQQTGYTAGAMAIRTLDEIMILNSPVPFWDYFHKIKDIDEVSSR
jgi:hypothetical protein